MIGYKKVLERSLTPYSKKQESIPESYNTYNCDVSNDFLDKSEYRALRKMKLGKILKVPVRQNGLTSSGKFRECHSNVERLVETYGGKHIVGYGLQRMKKKMVQEGTTDKNSDKTSYSDSKVEHINFYNHSVWLTPEGKLVCVTPSPFKKDLEGICHFIPIGEYKGDANWIECYPFMYKSEEELVLIKTGVVNKYKGISLDMLHRDLLVLRTTYKVVNDIIAKSGNGEFSKKSSATGKYWKDIYKKAS
tara:strand:- start:446 stop:1189 length:744 start_codon:yes stop_codon:yes gene_type:complete